MPVTGRDEAGGEFAAVLGEACRRMVCELEQRVREQRDCAVRCDSHAVITRVYWWHRAAELDRQEARELADLAQVYRWYGHMIGPYGPPGVCTCRLGEYPAGRSRYCPHVPSPDPGAW